MENSQMQSDPSPIWQEKRISIKIMTMIKTNSSTRYQSLKPCEPASMA